MTEKLDLDIDSYDLREVLDLFDMPLDFGEEDVKRAKKKALMSHPDKSGLEAEVFMFYAKAYKIVLSLWKARNKREKCVDKQAYNTRDAEVDLGLPEDIASRLGKGEDFNKRFNELWEKARPAMKDDDEGHGAWLASSKGLVGTDEKAGELVRQRARESQLVRFTNPEVYSGTGGADLLGSRPTTYSSGAFGGTQYGDVREVYTETMIGVEESDYTQRKSFKNVDDIMRHRKQDDHRNSEFDHEQAYTEMKRNERISDTQRAFDLAKQDELAREQMQRSARALRAIADVGKR
jgi:hypothetical protein